MLYTDGGRRRQQLRYSVRRRCIERVRRVHILVAAEMYRPWTVVWLKATICSCSDLTSTPGLR